MAKDLYDTRNGEKAYATYIVYVDVGEAEDEFNAWAADHPESVETDYQGREWK